MKDEDLLAEQRQRVKWVVWEEHVQAGQGLAKRGPVRPSLGDGVGGGVRANGL